MSTTKNLAEEALQKAEEALEDAASQVTAENLRSFEEKSAAHYKELNKKEHIERRARNKAKGEEKPKELSASDALRSLIDDDTNATSKCFARSSIVARDRDSFYNSSDEDESPPRPIFSPKTGKNWRAKWWPLRTR